MVKEGEWTRWVQMGQFWTIGPNSYGAREEDKAGGPQWQRGMFLLEAVASPQLQCCQVGMGLGVSGLLLGMGLPTAARKLMS
jgi:hypothetical protein